MATHDDALINLDEIGLVSNPLTESHINSVLDTVSIKIEELNSKALREQILKIDKAERDQGLESPYRDIEVPENIKLTTQVFDVMYNFKRIPDHWVSKNAGIISDTISLLQTKISERSFPETLIEETVRELEVAVFALLFNLDNELSELIYPIFKSLYLANEYVIMTEKKGGVDENSIEFSSILDLIKKSDPKDFLEKFEGNAMSYVKILIYRILLERIGNFTLPSEERERNALNVPKELLMKMIPTSRLIELGIIAKGTEVLGSETSPFLTNFERARLIGERAREISEENAPVMTDPGSLIDAQAIAEKELDELVIPLKVCRKFPDGSERIWCASSLAKARDEFYDFLKENLDKVSVEGLYQIAIEHGYASEIREKMLDFIRSEMELDIQPELLELRALNRDECISFFEEIKDLLLGSGLSEEDLHQPLYILRLLLPIMKTYPTLKRLLVVDVCSNFFDNYSDVDWVNIPGSAQTDPSDRPRRLTRYEIDSILDSLPQVRSALKGLSIEARKSMQEKMRYTLQEIEICPSGIPELKQSIVIQFNKSQVDAGSAVGINAADALGEQVSQMTLNSFHSAGTNKNMSSGIKALSELIFAIKNRKNNNCVIVFKERLSFEEILDKEADIVETNVGQLVVEWDVGHPDYLEKYWWHDYFTLPKIDDTTRVLRLQLNPALMVERKVTMSDVIRGLNKGQKKDGIPPSSLYYAHSSTEVGILDIYPRPELIKQSVGQIEQKIGKASVTRTSNRDIYRSDIFLNNIILANLDYIHIRGILDIEEIYVTKAPVLEILAKEYKIGINERNKYYLDPGKYWRMVYDVNLLAYSPIKPSMLIELLEAVGYEVVRKERNGCIVIYRGHEEGSVEGAADAANNKPSETIKREVDVAMEAKATEAEKRKEERKDLTDYQKKLIFLSTYNLLNTRGSYLYGLMEEMDIDMYYTYSNNIHLMRKVYGVEAARQFFIKELYDAFTIQDGYVNARNISLLADFLFRYGSFLGTNYTGMKAGTTGYFSLATFERSLEVFAKAAIFSETESLEGISASIAVGKPVTIGTGFFSIISDHSSNVISKKERKEEKRVSDAKAIALAMKSGACSISFEDDDDDDDDDDKNPFSIGEYEGVMVDEGLARLAPTTDLIVEMAEEATECPPTTVEKPSNNLGDAIKGLPSGFKADLEEEEIETRVVEIPSQIRQVSLRTGPIKSTAPSGTPLSESEKEEITYLEEDEVEELHIDFTNIPVIKLSV